MARYLVLRYWYQAVADFDLVCRVKLAIAATLLVVTVVLLLLCIPYLTKTPEPIPEPTEPTVVTEPPATEEPTLPPPEPNPFDELDFQYDGRFLKLIEGESRVGIDVSSWQYDIDWEAVAAAGAEFAIIRIGYRGSETGLINPDKYAQQNLAGAAAAGLDIGVYFFSQALNEEEVQEEIDFILDIIKDYEITMPVVFDWEYISDEARTADMDARTLTDLNIYFCETMEEAGYTPMIYFNSYQAKNMMFLYELEDYPFWLAYYSYRMNYPYRVEMWQYTSTGRVPGIGGNVDINVMMLDQKLRPK